MEWITSLLEGENGSAIQLVLITVGLALALIILFWLFRRIAGTPARRAAKNRVPRLSITDFKDIGDKRHLILARRDNVEHLILIGGPNDLVIETGIVRAQSGQNADRPVKSATKSRAAKVEPIVKGENEKSESASAELGTAAVTGAATAAGVAMATAETTSETVSTATENVADSVSDALEPLVDTATEVTETVTETVTAAVDDNPGIEVVETVEIAEPQAEPSPATTETSDIEINFDDSDLEATLSDALTNEPLLDETAPEATPVDDVPVSAQTVDADLKQANSPDDEMQKLLAELASETKEPA